MLVTGFPAGTFKTDCWLVAAAPGSEALVVDDPGQDALAGIEELCARHRLKPVAALLTHGHLDHVWTVAPLAGAHGIPAFVHPDDRHLLTLGRQRAEGQRGPGAGQSAGPSPLSWTAWSQRRYSRTNVAPTVLTIGCTSAKQSQPPSTRQSPAWPKRAWRSPAAASMARRMRTRGSAGGWLTSCPRG